MLKAEILVGVGAMALSAISETSGILWIQIPAGLLFFSALTIFIVRRCRGVN